MAEATQKQVQLLIPSHEVMSHFCYAYAKALLMKLLRLLDEDKFFRDGVDHAKRAPDNSSFVTEIGDLVTHNLADQIQFPTSMCCAYDGVHELVATATEFLAIFEA